MNIKITIIIINWNGKELLRDCLNSIKKNTKYKNYKIIVVDYGSVDGSIEMLKSKFKQVDLVKNEKNLGFVKGNNIGIKYAIRKYNPDYFFFLNNDTKVTKNWLTKLMEVVKLSNKKVGIFGCKQLTFQRKPSISAGWILPWGVKYYYGKQYKEVNWVSGACFLVKKEVIRKIGMFDPKYSPGYYEETDLEQRALRAGFKIIYVPISIILHKGSATAKKLDENYVFYIFYRNRIRFFKKNFPFYYLWLRILFDFFKAIKLKKLPLLLKAYYKGIRSLK